MKLTKRFLIILIIVSILLTIFRVGYLTLHFISKQIQENQYATVIAYCIFILIPILGGLFLRWAYRKRNLSQSNTTISRDQSSQSWLIKIWNRSKSYAWDGTIIAVGIGICHTLVWYLWPDFWLEWKSMRGFFFFQIASGIGLLIFTNKKPKFIRFIGSMVVVLGLFGMLSNMREAYRISQDADLIMTEDGSFRRQYIDPEEIKRRPLLGRNAENEEFVKKFWRANLPSKYAEAMIAIAERESQFNQFEKDGTPYRGRINWKDVGIMQINEDAWLKKSISLDPSYSRFNIYTREGNLNFALWIFRKHGFKPWKVSSSGISTAGLTGGRDGKPISTEFIVIAPVGNYGSRIIIKGKPFKMFKGVPKGEVFVRNQNGIEFQVGPDKIPDIGPSDYLEYKSAGKEPIEVVLTYTY